MTLFQSKPLAVGFVVLCPTNGLAAIKSTVESLKRGYAGSILAVVSRHMDPGSYAEVEKLCPACRAGGTITSMINEGFDKSTGWNMIIMAGTIVRHGIDKKYSRFVEDESDILYAIVGSYHDFTEASLNGLMIHSNMWRKAVKFNDHNPLQICKLMWALDANDRGAQFKGIVGVRIT